jgi:hypothetical protein
VHQEAVFVFVAFAEDWRQHGTAESEVGSKNHVQPMAFRLPTLLFEEGRGLSIEQYCLV